MVKVTKSLKSDLATLKTKAETGEDTDKGPGRGFRPGKGEMAWLHWEPSGQASLSCPGVGKEKAHGRSEAGASGKGGLGGGGCDRQQASRNLVCSTTGSRRVRQKASWPGRVTVRRSRSLRGNEEGAGTERICT